MSKLLVDVRTLDLHPPQSVQALPAPGAHLSLVDRASLHLGLWLLLKSTRRANRRADHESRARVLSDERHRVARDQATLRLHQLWPRP